MLPVRVRPGPLTVVLAAVWAAGASAAEPRAALPNRPAPPAAQAVTDAVAPAYRDAVGEVVRRPTLSASAAEDGFTAQPAVYDWLLEHPDRTSAAWPRMGVPCVEITAVGDGRFAWGDEHGSELTWRTVGRLPDGVVWYASGKVKPGPLMPMVPVKAVAVLRASRGPVADDGAAIFKPSVSVYLLTDSRAAAAILRVIGPAAPRMAEQGAEQLLLFYSGVARYARRHPERLAELLGPAKKPDR